jgi:hypothetical protein
MVVSSMSDLRERIAAVVDERIRFWNIKQGYIVDGIDGYDVADALIAAGVVTMPDQTCNGMCLAGAEVGVSYGGIAYAHPDCELHG